METNNQQRSQEVNEILKRMPSGILRWGIGLLTFIVVGLLVLSYTVIYPTKTSISGTFTIEKDTVFFSMVKNVSSFESIQTGQTAILKVAANPNREYVVLEGIVVNDRTYDKDVESQQFKIVLDRKRTTNIDIPRASVNRGTAEIVTHQQRLLLKFLGK